ncbi:class I adenylate-forming enzyme family protein [Amycolatopsis sp. FDAARGOS 1241]|uniref:class I adenylate-forming enzyme family protein n=1 Tax=Amycolatopsis sp. FDAARGOS 1241 TaxID=2778070 RepID=UPI0019528762|nr:fatty acid--CoA ligase family protein [Amycolatopsis sp. FDAARGOS 1241]QRP47390.1 long-chain fatty acid--CoA ligase [Amycolatopsis sp. FDAARGOS 1241]
MSFFLDRVLAALESGGDTVLFHHDGRATTYSNAAETLERIHTGLGGFSGTIAIDAPNRPEVVLTQVAAQARNLDVLLVAASASRPARDSALARTGAKLITDTELDELIRQPPSTLDELPERVTAIFPTGGTTGEPKLIRHSGIYDGMARIFRPDGTQTVLVAAPLTHMTGNAAVLGALLCGNTVVLRRQFDAEGLLDDIQTHRVTALSLTPPRLAAVLDSARLETTDVSSVQSLSLGAAPLPPRRLARALEVFGPVVGQGYGLTEAPMIASISAQELEGRPERLGSVGRIVPGMEAKIEDHEVLVRGLSMMDGYLGEGPIRDAWLRTGDLGHFDEEGYLYLHDRKDDVIITGERGTKVASTTVENALLTHPGVTAAAVFAVPGAGGEGELVRAVVTTAGATTAEELKDHVRGELGGEHFVPSSVDFTGHLPLTPVGKVDKRALGEPFWRHAENRIA